MSLFLAPDELREVTGYRVHARQRKWLNDHGWKHEVARTGRPIVLRAEMERHMLGKTVKREREMNLKALAA